MKQVRALAIRLLVDEFRLGIGAAGAPLARAVLLPPSDNPDADHTETARTVPSARIGGGDGDGGLQDSAGGSGAPLLGELLRHRTTLEESDRERYASSYMYIRVGVVWAGQRLGRSWRVVFRTFLPFEHCCTRLKPLARRKRSCRDDQAQVVLPSLSPPSRTPPSGSPGCSGAS